MSPMSFSPMSRHLRVSKPPFLFGVGGASVSGRSGSRTNLCSAVHTCKLKKEDVSEVKHRFLNVSLEGRFLFESVPATWST